jgi:hypothetical protein
MMAKDTKTLAAEGTAIALQWILRAQDSLQGFEYCWSHKATGPFYAMIEDAVDRHFQLVVDSSKLLPHKKLVDATLLTFIKNNFRTVKEVLEKSGTCFKFPASSAVPALNKTHFIYTYGGMSGSINFNPDEFTDYDTATGKGFGPKARGAMVLHEGIHIADTLSGPPNHIYEHEAGYNSQRADQAIHNASSYASFAQHVTYGRDTRYGGDPSRSDRRAG